MKQYPLHKVFSKYSLMYPPISKATLPFIRFAQNLLPKNILSDSTTTVTKVFIPISSSANIQALLYSPSAIGDHAPCLIYYHGDGFMLEAAPYHYALAKEYVTQILCKILFVSYRLAPKHPFPTPVKDCFTALKWTVKNAAELGSCLDKNSGCTPHRPYGMYAQEAHCTAPLSSIGDGSHNTVYHRFIPV